jgi:hypothetical protein
LTRGLITSIIFGVVRDDRGNPIPEARVSFLEGPVPLPDVAALTDIDGFFALSAPIAGEYIIAVNVEQFEKKELKIILKPNEKKDVEIKLFRTSKAI